MKNFISLFFLLASVAAYSQIIDLQPFAYGFNTPVEIANAGDSRLFIVEWAGNIRIANADGTVNQEPFLAIPSGVIMTGAERGLLGLAFHPEYATNGYFFICYTSMPAGDVTIARYSRDPSNPNLALPDSQLIILSVPHLLGVHNGGCLRFGPDGYLYLGIGDGADPITNAQNIDLNLGKMLRLDVNNSTQANPYVIPADNPFVGIPGNDEIWAVGLRNPWKYSFNRISGELWIADVGESLHEEINRVAPTAAGINYGWSCYEGSAPFFVACGIPLASLHMPFVTYQHAPGLCSVIGGFVYTGLTYPALQNKYFFADLCANKVFAADLTTGNITTSAEFPGELYYFMTLGEDAAGEIYIAGSSGIIYKIVDATLGNQTFDKFDFGITPNPASAKVSIKFTNATYPIQLHLSDVSGKILLQQTLHHEAETVSTDLLQRGLYIVTVKTATNQVSSKKLIVGK